jgi:membrane protein DedA with SNARE-associated domain/rhodanese-related sulfurtransferase
MAFLLHHGYWLTMAAVFAEQVGLPLPAVPILVGMGALSRSNGISLSAVILIAVSSSMVADLIWYVLGRRHGRWVLRLICRIALEPDFCVRRTEDMFVKRGLWSLPLAKFVPGLNAAAVPLAGMVKSPVFRFLGFDLAGLLLWSGAYAGLGYLFSNQIERLIGHISRFGHSMLFLIGAAVGGYVAYKISQRRRFLRSLAGARISPEELRFELESDKKPLVFDLRNPLDIGIDRIRIPGAFHVLPEALAATHEEIPRDEDIVLYCTCPNEATSARVARQLLKLGIRRVRSLAGGLDAWRARGFPVEAM